MQKAIRITTPLNDETVKRLRAGDKVLISGIIYTARDAAHKRLTQLIRQGKKLPFDLRAAVIFYAGPAPAKPGQITGPIGPTTSGRMDSYAPTLIKNGLKGMIGKGCRSEEVKSAMRKNKAVYFVAVGGTAALLKNRIRKSEVIAYEGLGTEAVRMMEVEDFPVIVANDIFCGDVFIQGIRDYKRK